PLRLPTDGAAARSPRLVPLRRPVLIGVVAALAAAFAPVAPPSPARAATTTLYASPAGTGTACTSAQPCPLAAAQTAVRSLNAGMSGDIVVELAGGVYRLSTPLQVPAAASGNNGDSVRWKAAAGA